MLPTLVVVPLGGDIFSVKSERTKGVSYLVERRGLTKSYACECPDWQYRRSMRGEDCKHIRAVKEKIVQIGTWIGGL